MSVYLPPVMSDVVVDLSHWQAPVDFAKAKAAGIAAVILKATEGVDFVDPTFAVRCVSAAAAGLLVGAYHFFDTADPIAQTAFFMEHAGAVPLLALDFEPSPTSVTLQNRGAVFVTTVRAKLGRWPLLYTGRWEVAPANLNFSQCPLWLAEYGSKPCARRVGRNGRCGSTRTGGSAALPGRCPGSAPATAVASTARSQRSPPGGIPITEQCVCLSSPSFHISPDGESLATGTADGRQKEAVPPPPEQAQRSVLPCCLRKSSCHSPPDRPHSLEEPARALRPFKEPIP